MWKKILKTIDALVPIKLLGGYKNTFQFYCPKDGKVYSGRMETRPLSLGDLAVIPISFGIYILLISTLLISIPLEFIKWSCSTQNQLNIAINDLICNTISFFGLFIGVYDYGFMLMLVRRKQDDEYKRSWLKNLFDTEIFTFNETNNKILGI